MAYPRKHYWTAAQLAALQARYADHDTRELAAELGMDARLLVRKAYELGLHKSAAGLSASHDQADSLRHRLRALLAEAGEQGIGQHELARRLGAGPAVVSKQLSALVTGGRAWRSNRTGRRDDNRWFAEQPHAQAHAPAFVPSPTQQAAQAERERAEQQAREAAARAALPAVEDERTVRTELPTPPGRFEPTGPVEAGFASLPPGRYPHGCRDWVRAVTPNLN